MSEYCQIILPGAWNSYKLACIDVALLLHGNAQTDRLKQVPQLLMIDLIIIIIIILTSRRAYIEDRFVGCPCLQPPDIDVLDTMTRGLHSFNLIPSTPLVWDPASINGRSDTFKSRPRVHYWENSNPITPHLAVCKLRKITLLRTSCNISK